METLVEQPAPVEKVESFAKTAPVITKDDYCDGCGSANKTIPAHVATNEKIGSLMYCGHHARKYAEGLTKQGFVIEPPVVMY